MRYGGYNGPLWDRPEPYPRSPPPHGPAFHPLHPPPAVSPLQPALMVDVSQVCIFILTLERLLLTTGVTVRGHFIRCP